MHNQPFARANLPDLSGATREVGYFNFIPDLDGSYRRVPLAIRYGGQVALAGHSRSQVLAGRFRPEAMAGRRQVVGSAEYPRPEALAAGR